MNQTNPAESVWTAIPDAEFAPLKRLPHAPPTPERAQALETEARKDVAARAEAYRTPVTAETLRLSIP
jgi:hypothetical protein